MAEATYFMESQELCSDTMLTWDFALDSLISHVTCMDSKCSAFSNGHLLFSSRAFFPTVTKALVSLPLITR
ncbi:unnamed protein product [Cochlearia groenlandica]